MSAVNEHLPQETQLGREQLSEGFEAAWKAGRRPVLEHHLPAEPNERLAVLIQLVRTELELRLQAGELVRVEEYLGRFPELAALPEVEWGLIVAEGTQRALCEPDLSLGEYLNRFPRWQADLLRWWPGPALEQTQAGRSTIRQDEVPAAPEPRPGWPQVPGYEVLAELGRGGMGVVYLARQIKLNRPVALKVILAGDHAGARERVRFRREAEVVARLRHPHIVQVHEFGEAEGRPFFSLELVEGGNLAQKLGGKPLPAHQAARLVELLARAMESAHQQGVIHRDLKPANILLVRSEGPEALPLGSGEPVGYEPRISDFGLARLLDQETQTATGAVLGTPSYMAPEQASGKNREVGLAADVYALGVILYELLTGRPPFLGETLLETLLQVQTQEPVPPRRLLPKLSRDLETVCLKCLEKQPRCRYASAAELAEDLRRFQAGEPVRARPVGRAGRAWRWCRRKPALTSMLAVLVLVILGSLAGMTVLYLNARQREEEARAVTRFYETSVLSAARPHHWAGGFGKNVTLLQVLDRAAPKIEAAFAGRPKLEAAVRDVMGVTYYFQGQYQAANPHLEKAYALRLQVLGPDHPDTLTSLHNLARQRWRQGKLDEAVAKCREALQRRRRTLGSEQEETLLSQICLGLFLAQQSQFNEAEGLLRPAVAIGKRTLPPGHHHLLYGQFVLAGVFEVRGQLDEAAKLYQDTLEAELRATGPEQPNTLNAQSSWARVLGEQGKLNRAQELLRQTLEVQRRVVGPDFPRTLETQIALTRVLQEQEKWVEAEKLCRQALEAQRRLFGSEHFDTLSCQNTLASLRWEQGQHGEAEPLFRETLDLQRKALGQDHLDLATTLYALGGLLTDRGRPAEAEPLLRECLAIREKKLVPECWHLAAARSLLGGCLARQKKFAEAKPLLLTGCEGLVRTKYAPSKQVAQAFDRVIELYEKWGKPEQAEAWRQKRPVWGKESASR